MPGPCAPASAATRMPTWPPWNSKRASQLCRPRKKSLRASEQDRPDVARHRRRWRVWQRYMDADRFVFIDETAATTAMTRLSGWGPRGERLVDAVPAGPLENTHRRAGPGGGGGQPAPFLCGALEGGGG